MVSNVMYQEYMESLAIKAASKLIDDALAAGIIEDQYDAQAQFCKMVDDFRTNRDEAYLKRVLAEGLDAIYGGLKHHESEEIL